MHPIRRAEDEPAPEFTRAPVREPPPLHARVVPETVLALQRSAGNAAVSRLLRAEEPAPEDHRTRFREAMAFWTSLATSKPTQAPMQQVEAAQPAHGDVLPTDQPPRAEASDEPALEAEAERHEAQTEPEATDPHRVRAQRHWRTARSFANPTGRRFEPTLKEAYPNVPKKTLEFMRDEHTPLPQGAVPPKNWIAYWLEAIDPLHRPGQMLAEYFQEWSKAVSGEAPRSASKPAEPGTELESEHTTFWEFLDSRPEIEERVTYLRDPAEREQYRLRFDGGGLYQKHPHRGLTTFDTASGRAAYSGASGWGIFVVSMGGAFFAGLGQEGKFHHSSFLGGAPVSVAGELRGDDGILEGITPMSGHYRPSNTHLHHAVTLLAANGVKLDVAKVGHIVSKAEGGAGLRWVDANDFLANGEKAAEVPPPPGRTADE
ncbi:hypothetical protein [Solirubrobacter soli]|uniref:hypothetical protein n=1 Tax=Solirubrobacter soli TaxID=363832 RepID=UPI0004196910|nr:hypothetical protein [Solirubrobacter soli]